MSYKITQYIVISKFIAKKFLPFSLSPILPFSLSQSDGERGRGGAYKKNLYLWVYAAKKNNYGIN
jgi:hypothetical protein